MYWVSGIIGNNNVSGISERMALNFQQLDWSSVFGSEKYIDYILIMIKLNLD